MKRNSIESILSIVCVATLLIGALNIQFYSYYELLRILIFFSSLYFVYTFYQEKNQTFVVAFSILALLFNPFSPIYLAKSSWIFIDIAAAALFFVSLEDFTRKTKEYFMEFPKNKNDKSALVAVVAMIAIILVSHTSNLWALILIGTVVVSILLGIFFNSPLAKSIIVQTIIVLALIASFIIFAVVRDIYFPSPNYSGYRGGYAPDGTYCDYGYKIATKECCDEDDYACEMCDTYGTHCYDKEIYQGIVDEKH